MSPSAASGIAYVTGGSGSSTVAVTVSSGQSIVVSAAQGGTANDIVVKWNTTETFTKATNTYQTVPTAGDSFAIFYLLAPTAGSFNVVATGTSISGIVVAVYSGVGSIGGSTGKTQSSGSSITTTAITATNANSWMVSAAQGRLGPHALTPSTGVTNDRFGATTNGYASLGDSGPASGSITHTWTGIAAAANDQSAASMMELVAA